MKNAITLNRLVISLVALIAVLTSITIAQCMLREGAQNQTKLVEYPPVKFTEIAFNSNNKYFEGSILDNQVSNMYKYSNGDILGAGKYTIKLNTNTSSAKPLAKLYDKTAGQHRNVVLRVKGDELSLTFTFPQEVVIKEFVMFNNFGSKKCRIEIEGTNVYDGTANPVVKIRGKDSYYFNLKHEENYKSRKSIIKLHDNNKASNKVNITLSENVKKYKFIQISEVYFMVEDPSVAAAEEAALAAKNDMIVSGSGTSSSTPGVGVAGAATPATGAASAAPADETTAAAAAAATTAAVSAAADTGTSSMDASTLAAVGAAAAVTAAEEVAAVEEEDTSSSYEATVIDSSTSSESTPMFGTAIDGHLDPAFRADNIYQDGSTMSSYDSNMASQYHGSSPYGGVPVHHHYHPPQHIHHPYQHGHHPYSYSHQPMDKSVVIKHELSDEADKKITKTMNFMEYILKNSQKP